MRTVITAVVLAGRRIQPAAFAITLAALSIGLTWIGMERIDGPYEQVMGWGGFIVAALLTAGWAVNDTRLMRGGLLGSVFLWCLVAWVAWTAVSMTSALLAVSWAVLGGGSYWLEELDARAVAAGLR